MAGFLERRLPDAICRGSSGGPRTVRAKAYAQGGQLTQLFRWTRPLQHYDISFGIKTREDFEPVRALWYVVMGPPHYAGFRFKDWNDYRVTQLTGSLVLVSGSDWQLSRRYSAPGGLEFYDRPIYKPVSNSAMIYRNRGGVISVASATVNYSTGIASIAGHQSGDTYSWEGEFDVPVTFENDAMDNIDLGGTAGHELLSLPSIMLEELREVPA